MKIGEVARQSGLSVPTIRWYERIGLLPRAGRDGAGRRDYDAGILDWIGFVKRLRDTGMPVSGMLAYARLRAAGPATGPARQALLEAHRAAVAAQVALLQDSLAGLDAKIAGYADGPGDAATPRDPEGTAR